MDIFEVNNKINCLHAEKISQPCLIRNGKCMENIPVYTEVANLWLRLLWIKGEILDWVSTGQTGEGEIGRTNWTEWVNDRPIFNPSLQIAFENVLVSHCGVCGGESPTGPRGKIFWDFGPAMIYFMERMMWDLVGSCPRAVHLKISLQDCGTEP